MRTSAVTKDATGRRRTTMLIGLAVAGAVVATGFTAPASYAAAADGVVTVRVVQEVNANGLVDDDLLEPPLIGVAVRLSDASGNRMDAVTDANGLATFAPAGSRLEGGSYRVDVENPRPGVYRPGHAAGGQTPAAALPIDLTDSSNAKLSSATEFVDVRNGQDQYVNTSFWYPPYYCQENAALCGAVQPWDAPPGAVSPATESTLLSAPYRFTQQDAPLATKADTGAVYGIAYDRARGRVFSAAYAKRGSGYGPGGPGAIYATDLASTAYPLSGSTSLFATVPGAGADHHDMGTNHDYGFFDRVGKESLGDIDVTHDDRWLFGVNLAEKSVFVYDLEAADPAASLRTAVIPNPCAVADDWRPMGTGEGLETSYVGGVCSGQTAQDMSELSAHVFAFDPAALAFGSEVVDQPLTYDRGRAYNGTLCTGSDPADLNVGRWFSWIDDYPAGPNEQRASGCGSGGWLAYPTPMLDDIVEETNGDLVLAFRDRFADQTGFNVSERNTDGIFFVGGEPAAGGDVVRGCALSDGTFVLDPNFDPAVESLAPGARCADNNIAGVDSGSQAKTYREYYVGDYRTGYHEESFYGGIALSRVEPNLVASGFDSTGAVWTQGIGAVSRDGRLPSGNLGVRTDDGTVDRHGEGSAMGGLAVLCDLAPLQIGNRVWKDLNGDGRQDAGEPPLPGVTVNLYDGSGGLVGTTETDADGGYLFGSANVAGGLRARTDYVIALDEPGDYATGAPLEGLEPAPHGVGSEEHDSDGVVPSGGAYPQAEVTTGEAGADDHSYDFGFREPVTLVSIGDYVWLDADGDGLQGASEKPAPGVEVRLLDAGGALVDSATTGSDGAYAFAGLPAGTDFTIEFPETLTVDGADYALTRPGRGGDRALDSNPDPRDGTAHVRTPLTGSNSPDPGQADDPTIDAGYAPSAQNTPGTPEKPDPTEKPEPSLPGTGGDGLLWAAAVGILLLLAGGIAVVRVRRENEETATGR